MGSNEPVSRARPLLNFDVLHLICDQLTEVSDVLSFSLTCSTLRNGALQRRLRMSPPVLSSPESVERFYMFLFSDPTSRAPHLHGLSISRNFDYTSKDSSRFIHCLVAILRAAVHLECLSFPASLGLRVCAAVAQMTTLRDLTVFSGRYSPPEHQTSALTHLLAALRSPLRRLYLTDHGMDEISASFMHDYLSHLAPTLESLTMENFPLNISPPSVKMPFKALRSLSIGCTPLQPHFYRLDVLLRLFPNLDGSLFLNKFVPPAGQHAALRERSKDAQRDYTWPRLDRVVFSAELAFMMALRCPIRCMDIDGPVLQEVPYLVEALRYNCPSQLLLPIMFSGCDSLKNLDGLFPPEAADRLRHLVVFAEIKITEHRRRRSTNELDNFTWKQFLDSFVESTKLLRGLTHLRLIFNYDIEPVGRGWPWRVSQDQLDQQPRLDFVQNIVQEEDLYPAAIRLLDAMQTLRYLFLTTCGKRRDGPETWEHWHSSKAWRVPVVGVDEDCSLSESGTKEGSRPCVELTSEEADSVIEAEELHLRHREEKMVRNCIENAYKQYLLRNDAVAYEAMNHAWVGREATPHFEWPRAWAPSHIILN